MRIAANKAAATAKTAATGKRTGGSGGRARRAG
jgi:hypothetical protein